MVGFEGLHLSAADVRRIAHPMVGGVLILAKNYSNLKQLREVTTHIAQINPQCIIAVDQEGGVVQRLIEGFTRLPAMQDLGKMYAEHQQDAVQYTCDCARIIAYELQQAGITLSFAPVLDLDKGNRAIRSRAFSADPVIVQELAGHFIDTLHSNGMLAVGKHFPGHGSVQGDTHTEIVWDRRDYDTIYQNDMQPFVHLIATKKLHALMTAHIIYPQVDDAPASLSNKWLHDILRQQLGFDGMVFSDDLNMKGSHKPDMQALLTMFDAGCDMALVIGRPDYVDDILKYSDTHDLQKYCDKTTMRWQAICSKIKPNHSHQVDEYQQAVSRITD